MHFLTAVATFVLIFVTVLYDRLQKRGRLPPGPRGFPILGNLWDIPAKWEWQTYRKWSEDYGMSYPPYS